MKKIYLTLALAVGLMTTSCELDIEPVGYLPTDSALETPSSFNAARATLYAALTSSMLWLVSQIRSVRCIVGTLQHRQEHSLACMEAIRVSYHRLTSS